ncbi:MAG: efflux RND transporter permease subunit [Deltaproteobacteria bacterium]|nr:efflux RND transporter permease subunit [Deltaproteobacteria bacterium]
MWIVRLALNRPYTFVVAALLLLLLTPLVLLRMPTDIFPSIDIPVVSVIWLYNGLSAQEIEQRIVYNHERMISSTVDGVEHTESTSYSGAGVIKVYLHPGGSVEGGVAQITASAQAILRRLPAGQAPPIIIRYNASTVPILQYSLSSRSLSEQELQDLAFNQVRIGLANVKGSSVPYPYGGKARIVSVDLDLAALKAKRFAPLDVVNAINAQNFILPSGTARIGPTEYDVAFNSSPEVLEQLNDLPLRTVDGAVIRVRDVAHVHDGAEPQQNVVRLDGVRGVLLTILKNGTASTLDVVRGVKASMPRILADLPPELEVREFADQSLFVRAAIGSVVKEGVIAAALTAAMILLFLGSWRSTLIIALSIPLSVLSSIVLLHALGETINLMTLGGLALAVGILVDDATVTIENIHRQMALGKPTPRAILDGAEEIALPAFVGSLCIVIVFVPMFFLTGTARYLFVPLAEAVVFAVLASYALSRTLVPTLVLWLYRGEAHAGDAPAPDRARPWVRPFAAVHSAFERGFVRLRESYGRALAGVLAHRAAAVGVFLAFCAATALLLPFLGQDFFPAVDTGALRLHLRARTGTRIEETARLTDEVEKVIRQEIPAGEIAGILDNIGIPSGGIPLTYIDSGLVGTGDADILVSLKPGHAPTDGYARRLRKRLAREFPGTTFYQLPADIVSQTLNFGLPAPIDVQLTGRDQAKLRAVAQRFAEKARRVDGVVDVRVQQPADLPRLKVEVDRTKASGMGLTARDVANSLLLGLSGSSQAQPSYWLNPKNGVQYLVNVRVPQTRIESLEDIASIPAGTSRPGEGDVPLLGNLASIRRAAGAPVATHRDIQPVVDVFGGVAGRDLGGVLADLRPLIAQAEKELPPGAFLTLRGQAETMRASYAGLGVGLLLAMALVYLLLVVNFQSWTDPFIIVSALPAALAGVVWGLYVTFTALSVPALMGAIMSLGVATANSVLVVSFVRSNLEAGLDPIKAAWEAGTGRLRPVLMTALAMIIGMIPLALGVGEGGEQNAPLGRAVIGGLVLATLATLLFVPVVFAALRSRFHGARSTRLETEPSSAPAS